LDGEGVKGIWEGQDLEIEILGIAIYIQTSSVRRAAKILSEFHPVSKSAVVDKEV